MRRLWLAKLFIYINILLRNEKGNSLNLIPGGSRLNTAAPQYFPLLIALLGVIGTLLAIYGINHRFFFADDRQTQYFPYGLVIKDMLLHGHFPFVTTRTFFGGALWLDPQNGIYNPLALVMTLLIDPAHLDVSGLWYAIIMNALLAAGAYALGRAYRLEPSFAALLGLMTGLNFYTLYINSADWHPGATSMAWLMFAWASMKKLLEAHSRICLLILSSAAFIFLSVSAGWPHNDVTLAVVMFVMFCREFLTSRRNALRLVWAGALGAALCLPVMLPVLAAQQWIARPFNVTREGLFMPKMADLLNFSNPAWFPDLSWFVPGQHAPCPFFFIAWYALPLLMLTDMRRLKWPADVLIVAAVLALLTTQAGQLGPLRFPMRWLPDLQMCLLLALFSAIQKSAFTVTLPRMLLVFGVLALTTLTAFAVNPHVAPGLLSLALLTAIFIDLLPLVVTRGAWLPAFLGATSVMIVLAIVAQVPPYLDLGKSAQTPPAPPPLENRVAYTLYSGAFVVLPNHQDETEYLPAATGIYYGVPSVAGYSSVTYRSWSRIFGCKSLETPFCVIDVSLLRRSGPETKASYLDLVKIDTVAAEKGEAARRAGATLARWKQQEMANSIHFTRPPGNPLPGTVSWHSKDVSLGGSAQMEPDGESLTVKNSGAGRGLITFARLFFPGFRAFLNDQELNVRAVDDLVVGVEVPPRAAGTLRLTFLPPLLGHSLALAALALLLWAVAAFLEKIGRLKRL